MSSYATIKDRLELEIQEYGFVTPGKLPQLCSTEDIRLLLGLNHLDRRPQDIFASFLKIFSILVLLDQPSVILECLGPGLNDEWAFKTFQQQPFFKDGDLRGTVLEPFGGLLHKQWVFPPPLSRDIHYEFPPAFLDALPKKDKRKIGRGNYGTIYKHHFQKGQLKDYPNGGVFALKQINQKVDTSREDLKRECDIMRDFRHAAVTPLLASFEVSAAGSLQSPTDVYIVMPLAEGGNMEEWIRMATPPDYLPSIHSERQSYLLDQIESLYGALAFLHTPKSADSLVVLHFDLRPKNFLLFMDSTPAVWKISDFGIAQLAKTSERRRTHTTHLYAPPEAYGPNGHPTPQAYGREFDTFSMACVSLQLLTLAYKGWGNSIFLFDEKRLEKDGDGSFGRCRSQVYSWIEGLGGPRTDHSQVIDELINLVKETIEKEPEERPMAWEILVYMFLAKQSTPYLFRAQLDSKLREIVPRATDAESSLSQGPIDRATRKRHYKLVDLLQEKGWTRAVKSGLELYNSNVDPGKYLSNLPDSSLQNRLMGKAPKEIISRIHAAFNESLDSGFVGLWGLGGMGKSHIAYTYASQFQKNSEEVSPRHTFWINASDSSKLNKSCEDIRTRVGSSDNMDPLRSINLWLEKESNGPWVLVLDGFDHVENVKKWSPELPRAKHGMTIITTRDRDIVEEFTQLKPQSTIHIDPLPVQDAHKVFNDCVKDQDATYKPTDEQFRKLYGFVLTPLFTRLAAAYIVRGEGGAEAIDGLIEKLSHNQTYMERFDSAGKTETGENRLMYVFSFFLSPFDVHHAIESEEFILLGTLACFASDDLSLTAFKGLCGNDSEVARRYLAEYVSYGFITRGSPGSGKYKMHDLVAEFILRHIAQKSGTEKATMICFRWMLDRIYRMYCDERESIYEARDSRLRRDSYSWKLQYLPHFEEFSRYIQRLKRDNDARWRIEDWKMRPFTARSIITFSQAFASQNRIDHAIDMLRFAVRQGLEYTGNKEKDFAEWQRVTIKVFNSLATRLEDKRPVGDENKYLDEALDHAKSGLQMAQDAHSADLIWRLSLQVIRILTRLGRFHEAAEQMKDFREEIEELGPKMKRDDKIKVVLDGEKALATLFFKYGRAKGKREFLLGSSKIYRGLIEWLQMNAPREESTLDSLKAALALVLIEVPDPDLLDEACGLYEEILKTTREKQDGNKIRTDVVDDELNLAILRIRQNKPQDAAKTLKPVYDQVLSQFGSDDELTKSVKRTLAMAEDMVKSLEASSRNRTSWVGECGFNSCADAHRTWASDMKSQHEAYEFGISSMSTSGDVLLDLILRGRGKQVEKKQEGTGMWGKMCILL
ncbi:hypothetical protein KAF25_005860 [Fusarium avenaceum]|uniref:EKC/KEOPS complex subunit BUD32 n=1 Tax=Fusarium avenaceum TaxID=40199 RepID=A0A9P7KLD9_9HYPO|nr:hypothetical protein KAF25_005860 [Fusarium avenaceum]